MSEILLNSSFLSERQIVAFIGRAGSGKDYQCSLLEKQGYKKMAFADALRDIAFTILDLDKQDALEHYEAMKNCLDCIDVKVEDKSIVYQHKELSFRRFLELLGTQGIRKYDEDFWIRCVIKQIEDNNYNKVCISDMRFANEYIKIHNYCINNKINFKCIFCDYHSPRYQEYNKHESAQLSNFLVNNGFHDLDEITSNDICAFMNAV